MSKVTSQGYSVEFGNDLCQLKNSKKYMVVHGIWKKSALWIIMHYVPCNRVCECSGVSAHVASATKPTHVATSVVEPTHIATSVIELVHVVASASCIWCKLMASIVGPSCCWQFEVTSKTKASRWIFHPQGYKIGILQRSCA